MTIVKKYKIFHSFLTKKQQSKFYLIILFLIFQSILEVVGIGMIIPLISIIIDSEKNFFFDFIGLNLSSFSLHKTQLIFLTLTVIFVFFTPLLFNNLSIDIKSDIVQKKFVELLFHFFYKFNDHYIF